MIAERLQQALAEPFQINKQKVRGSASIGIVVGTPESKSVDALLRDADIAMYRAKAAGRGRLRAVRRRHARRRAEAPDVRDGASSRDRAKPSHGLLSADRPAALVPDLRTRGTRAMGARRRPDDAAVGLHRRCGRDRTDCAADVSGPRTGVPSGGRVAADVRPAAGSVREHLAQAVLETGVHRQGRGSAAREQPPAGHAAPGDSRERAHRPLRCRRAPLRSTARHAGGAASRQLRNRLRVTELPAALSG